MKRILLETLCATAILVFLASLHGRVSSLKENRKEVAELRELVTSTTASLSSLENIHRGRVGELNGLETKLATLEKRVAAASFSTAEARKLQDELGATRREAALVKAQLRQDISRTQQAVDTYQVEMRTKQLSDGETLRKTRDDLAKLAEHMQRDPKILTQHLLSPAVQLNGDDTVGSGTIIHSGKNPKTGKIETYMVTSFHVVRNILKDTPRAKREGIAVTIYHTDRGPNEKDREELRCDMVSHDEKIDAALLKLRSEKRFSNVARVLTKAAASKVRVWDPIYAVGCPLGNDPIPSKGQVSSLKNRLNGANYWMINAPTYFGNSGGAIYTGTTHELAGVFSKIYTHGRGTPVVIPHMGLFTPMPAIYKWLEATELGFVLNNSTATPRRPLPNIRHLAAPPR